MVPLEALGPVGRRQGQGGVVAPQLGEPGPALRDRRRGSASSVGCPAAQPEQAPSRGRPPWARPGSRAAPPPSPPRAAARGADRAAAAAARRRLSMAAARSSSPSRRGSSIGKREVRRAERHAEVQGGDHRDAAAPGWSARAPPAWSRRPARRPSPAAPAPRRRRRRAPGPARPADRGSRDDPLGEPFPVVLHEAARPGPPRAAGSGSWSRGPRAAARAATPASPSTRRTSARRQP